MGAYLDHAASTPVSAEAFAAMVPHLTDQFANPSGVHARARAERRAIDDARDQIAEAVGCGPGEIVFTSGGTEADNLAVLGVIGHLGGTALVSAIEHHGVLRPAERVGAGTVPVTGEGIVALDALAELCGPEVRLVSVMAVNNEVGTVQPLAEVAEIVRERAPNALLHTDAVQALAWCEVDDMVASFDLVTISGHKIGAPKGVGALVVRGRAAGRVDALLLGGPQERELRAGTENVAGIVALGVATESIARERAATISRIASLRDRLCDSLAGSIPGLTETAPRARRVAANAHLRFPGIDNEEFLILLDDANIAASAGSSCASGALEPSHVLLAMGLSTAETKESVRFSLGPTTTKAEIDFAIEAISTIYARLAQASTNAAS